MKHKRLILLVVFFISIIVNYNCFGENNQVVFKEGDKIVFIGNSITQDGRYHAFLQAFCATRYPDVKVEYYNCGISGDNAGGMISRFESDVLIHKPTHAFLMTGMNDVSISLYTDIDPSEEIFLKRENALKNYYLKTEQLAQMLVENHIQPIFLTPTIYDETVSIPQQAHYGANAALAECAMHIRKLAQKHKAPCVDLHALLGLINEKMQAADSSRTIIGIDRIHPQTTGHFVMTYEIINTILPSSNVSLLSINSSEKKVNIADNCQVEMQECDEGVSFKVLANALPFPLVDELNNAMHLVPFQHQFNSEKVIISSLERGNYTLFIDDIAVGEYSSEELKEGVELANNPHTPQHFQSLKIYELCFQYHKIMGQLRSISFVEYRMLNKYDGPNETSARRAYLSEHLENQKGESWYEYNKKCVNDYYHNLPLKEKLWQKLSYIRNQIYTENKPQWHNYLLEKII